MLVNDVILYREIRELVEWVVSEPMIVYYIQSFCDVMWPQGKLAPAAPARTDAVSFPVLLHCYQLPSQPPSQGIH